MKKSQSYFACSRLLFPKNTKNAGLAMITPKTSFFLVALVVLIINNGGYGAESKMTAEHATGREASLQAYGLPKRFLSDNGQIVRMSIENHATANDSPVDNSSGTIEKIHLANPNDGQMSRNSRSIQENNYITRLNNMRIDQQDDDLLYADETKVFRPLFVYRQQMAAKRAKSIQRDKKIIAKKSKNTRHYYKF